MSSKTISPELSAAYIMADYKVFSDPPLTLNAGKPSNDLNRLLENHECSTAAYITACNPCGQRRSTKENQVRQKQLKVQLQSLSFPFFEGCGEDPTGLWPGEPSFLVLAIPKKAAIKLGRQFEQNAIIWFEKSGTPELIVLC